MIAKVSAGDNCQILAGPCLLENASINKPDSHSKAESSVFRVNSGVLPNEGDVVLLEPTGIGTVLYEIVSPDNAILLTEKCNSRCIMCPQPPKDSEFEEDYLHTALKTIELMHPATKVLGITGGEPTLVWKSLIKVFRACMERVPSISLQLLTNGRILKSYDKAEELNKVCGPNLFIGIPLYSDFDSLHDRHVGVKGAFWETVEGIFNLQRVGISTELRIVITRLNYERLPQWAEFVYRTFPFVNHIAFMELEPVGYASKNIKALWIDPKEYMFFLEDAARVLHRRDMSVSVYNCQLCNLSRPLWRFSRKSISKWKAAYMPECSRCDAESMCGGFFQSAQMLKMKNLAPLSLLEKLIPVEAQNG